MIQWQLKEMLAQKGIAQPHSWLKKLNISHNVASKMLRNQQQRVELRQLNIICTAAWCTPNDLFTWQPDENQIVEDSHPLQKMRQRAISQLNNKLKKLTPEQIAELDKLADELGNK